METERETNRDVKRNMHLVIKTHNLSSPAAVIVYTKAFNDLLFSLNRHGLLIYLNYSNTNLYCTVFFKNKFQIFLHGKFTKAFKTDLENRLSVPSFGKQ